MIEFGLFAVCLVASGIQCHALGKQEGIESTIEHLVDNGMLELDEE
jgi:hypothetical protein|tara:strand:+ start:690 stop:827 length:138 start_codon:yes stop_codon:yes gene_type:complete